MLHWRCAVDESQQIAVWIELASAIIANNKPNIFWITSDWPPIICRMRVLLARVARTRACLVSRHGRTRAETRRGYLCATVQKTAQSLVNG